MDPNQKWSGNLRVLSLNQEGHGSVEAEERKAMRASVADLNRGERIRALFGAEPRVLDILEEFLNEARDGEFIAGAIVLVRRDATARSCVTAPDGGRHHLVAACDYLKRDIIAETDN
jgi:hypothetical protein